MSTTPEWFIFGHNAPEERLRKILDQGPPPWRDFRGDTDSRHTRYDLEISDEAKRVVNTAILLRRPLLVTGDPGTGKSSLAHAIANNLKLGRVLKWSITSRSVLKDALYRYDAIGRLQAANLTKAESTKKGEANGIEKFLTLGPLGTALADSEEKPRVLLIDEIDKSDIDLPNDLLHVFEEGKFEIPELARLVSEKNQNDVPFIIRKDGIEDEQTEEERSVKIPRGIVRCTHFPIVIMTSNGDRDMPPAFLRRCLRLKMDLPNEAQFKKIVTAHLYKDGSKPHPILDALITFIVSKRPGELIATDQLMNAIQVAEQLVPKKEGDKLFEYTMNEAGRLVVSNNAQDDNRDLFKDELDTITDYVLKAIR